MKKLLVGIVMLVLLVGGCTGNQKVDLKNALKDALVVGQEIEKIEREKCQYDGNCKTADQIKVWIAAGQKIHDTDSFDDNCSLMMSVADIAYDWVSEKYPDEPYRIFIILLKSKLEIYCQAGEL